jgi:large subunit ribosomal protein L34
VQDQGLASFIKLERQGNMHYPHRVSKIKRKRKFGFLVRMRTSRGRKLINRRRRAGRNVNVD